VAEIFSKNGWAWNAKSSSKSRPRSRARRCAKNSCAADIGITGANFLVADSGAVVVVENEGNARLTYSAPRSTLPWPASKS
jgi:L-lactate dehydrogenase complex protein LldF